MISLRRKGTDDFKGFTLGEDVIWKQATCEGTTFEKKGKIIGFDKFGLLSILVQTEPDFETYSVREAINSFIKGYKIDSIMTLLKGVDRNSKCIWLSSFDIVSIKQSKLNEYTKNNPTVFFKSTFKPDTHFVEKVTQGHNHPDVITVDIAKENSGPVSDIKKAVSFEPSSHYEFGDGLNCMTFIEEAVKDLKGIEAFYVANAIKYLFRTTKKNGDDDLKKAHNYLTLTLKKRGLL